MSHDLKPQLEMQEAKTNESLSPDTEREGVSETAYVPNDKQKR